MNFLNATKKAAAMLGVAAGLVFAVGAIAQGVDTAYVPFLVNVDATILAEYKNGAMVVASARTSALANEDVTLVVPLSEGTGVLLPGSQRRTMLPIVNGNGGGKVALNLSAQSYKNATVALYSVNGKRVLSAKFSASQAVNSVSRRNVVAGVYLLSITGANASAALTSRITHSGGNLEINAAFGGDNLASVPQLAKKAAAGDWTISVSATETGYVDSVYTLKLTSGVNPTQIISLRTETSNTLYDVTILGGTGSGSYAVGAVVSITAETAPVGQKFTNWAVTSGGVTIANPNSASTSFTMPENHVTLTANFEALPTYTVAYNGNGYDGGTVPVDNAQYLSGETVTVLNAGNMTRTNYTFSGWSTAVNGSGAAYSGGGTFSISGNTTLYAKWTEASKPTYQVTVSSAGTGATGAGSYKEGETINITAGTPPSGKRFNNWTVTSSGVTLSDANSAATSFSMPANAVTVTAVFETIISAVTVTSAGTDASGDGSYAAGATVTITAGTAPADQRFKNWTVTSGAVTLSNANSATTTFVMPANAVTVTANFELVLTDSRDNKTYKMTVVGGKTWMAQNLNYQTTSGSWCYDNKPDSCNKYGRLYDWNTAKTVCPAGWHLPSRVEWGELAKAAGGTGTYGEGEGGRGSPGTKLKSTSGWNDYYNDAIDNGTDNYGFSALPGGYRNTNGSFDGAGYDGYWWTATGYISSNAYYRYMGYGYVGVYESYYNQEAGKSVRCLRD